ncbi:chromosomal replication initiator protein DnaA [Calorimonas adulescens]|jgi:chromosomal replication initiator protein DnaA|uniref:Chromosomal replication initiator protein DnaA n=1 Tax=Calorimonas adulescens TaxID=2606906 RepID=A0A5D8Q7Q6_9THEO|nr:chromosomal replication initiator protein DnaA [Calorimonas adulescens]TZE80765.1 chromosomal replication initiator protein DnaA [Calorimonas adulescens]
MNEQLLNLWERVTRLVKTELTEVSYNAWFRLLRPISMDNDTITIGVPNSFTYNIINERYTSYLTNAINTVSNKKYKVVIRVIDEDTISEQTASTISDGMHDNLINYLNSKYTFDSFVIGNSNRFAHAASLAVAQAPGHAYNPLFIYGGVGLGKTHLMHAIGHYILDNNKDMKVMYVTSEKFTNDLINAIKDDKNEEFRNKYRSVDVLLIDDIQFIGDKERTQEEFFHTFNTLYEANKQIVVSSDRPPKEIQQLEDRLISRFEWGLIADIQPPDFETRIAILKKKAQQENIEIPNDVMVYMAKQIQSNIRELEGALIKVAAYSAFIETEITIDMAEEALRDILRHDSKREINAKYIEEVVAKRFGIKIEDLKSKKRTKNFTVPRQIAMYLCRELTDMSLPKIGEEFGGKDHTTVIHSCEKISKDIANDSEMKSLIESLKKEILGE